jgi:hypothetical protein
LQCASQTVSGKKVELVDRLRVYELQTNRDIYQ